MKKWLQSRWFWPVVAVVLLTVLTRGQLLVAIAPWYKFLIPVGGGYFLYRLAKRKIRQVISAKLYKTMSDFAEAQRQAQEMMNRQQRYSTGGFRESPSYTKSQTVIEICPKCGEQKKPACPDCL